MWLAPPTEVGRASTRPCCLASWTMSKGQPPWRSPEGNVVVGRRWKYAPPPWVMYEALVNEHERWLTLLTGEVAPEIVASQRPVGVIFQPWVDPHVSAVEVRIEPLEDTGAALTVLAYADVEELPDDERRWVRYRLGTLFGAALRDWVDDPHWSA